MKRQGWREEKENELPDIDTSCNETPKCKQMNGRDPNNSV